MRIQPEALARLKAAPRGEALALIFEHMAKMAEVMGNSAAEQLLTYEEPGAQEGDVVPIIILALRPATRDRPTVDIPAQPASE